MTERWRFDLFCFKKELFRFSSTPRTNAIPSRNTNASYWAIRSHPLSQADSIKRRASQTTQCREYRVETDFDFRRRYIIEQKSELQFNLKRFSKILLTKARKIKDHIGTPGDLTRAISVANFWQNLKVKKESRINFSLVYPQQSYHLFNKLLSNST